ncbi:MAG: FIST C-terminal domain-containing protein [Alphaproteobacteria bacterium]
MTRPKPFKAAHASGDSWAQAVKACVVGLGTIEPSDTLGFVYATEALGDHISSILAFLRQTTRVQHWVGAIAPGVCACGVEYHEGAGLSVMVGALPPDSFQVIPTLRDESLDMGAGTRQWIDSGPTVLGVVHGDPRNGRLPAIIGRLTEDTGCFLVGGLTGTEFEDTQVADTPTGGGLSGVLLHGTVPVVVGLTQGCTPIGPVHTITEGMDNTVVALDGRPALEVLKEDVGEVLARQLHRVAGYVHAGFPVDGSDRGDYIVRNLIGIDTTRGWLSVGAEVRIHDRLLFVRRDPNTAQADLRRMVRDVKARARGSARGGHYVTCIGRGPNMFGSGGGELGMIREELGDLPITGFYANGEISHGRLHGYTGVLTLFL